MAKKGGSGKRKGGKFERTIARMLSKWWSGGTSDSIFWRSAGSGGMAKVRGRSQKKTYGQHGDITTVHPSGAPLVEMFVIECKNGYNRFTIQDLIDREHKQLKRAHNYDDWIKSCEESVMFSDAYSYLIIVKRDSRQPLVLFPVHIQQELTGIKNIENYLLLIYHNPYKKINVRLKGVKLDDFCKHVKPKDIIELSKRV